MRFFLLTIYLFISINLTGQSCGINFWSQNEIDSFQINYPGCTEIIGLQLDSDVTNLDSFYNVSKVSGIVYLSSNNTVDISGIGNLDSIMGDVSIGDITLNGSFNNVEYIGGYLSINNSTNNGAQVDFPSLKYVGEYLSISYYYELIDSFNLFNALDSVEGYIQINIRNANLEGFSQLQKAERFQFSINNNSDHYDIGIQNAFNNLLTTDRITMYGGSGAMISNSFSAVTTVNDLILLDFVSAPNFPFISLTSIDEITMRSVRELENLENFNPSLNISNKLSISSCKSLLDIGGILPNHIANLNILSLSSNTNLSLCDYDHICDLLDSSVDLTISNNSDGCKDLEQLTNRCTETGIAPINDQCVSAIEIFYTDPIDCTSGDLYTTNSARMHQETFCVTDFGEEVFFEFKPTESKAYSIMLADFDKAMGMELYQGSCTENALLQCGYSELSRYLEADSTYLISVFCDIPTEFTDFKICVGETNLEGDADGFGVNVSSPLQDLHIDGAILIGNTNLNYAGSIRFNGTHFQGFNGFGWVNLDSDGTIGFQNPSSIQETQSAKNATATISDIDKLKSENEQLKNRLKDVEDKLAELLKKLDNN